MENRKLTVKQKKFADEFIKTGNARESAIKAGYSKKTAAEMGYENLNKPHIKSYIDEKMKEIEDKQIAKAEEVLKHLTAAMRGEIVEEVVVTENTGDFESKARIVEKQISAKDRIKAAELLGKRYSLFTDKVDVEGNMGVKIIDDISSDEDEEN